jgi:carbonic anhydrase/acetyltransferase-like protein (isoleucine patch superfamily)
MALYSIGGKAPHIAATAFVAPGAHLIGQVELGERASVWFGAVIGKNCLVGAGAIVTEKKVFPDRSLILGAPAKVVRQLTDEDVARLMDSAANYAERAATYGSELTLVE